MAAFALSGVTWVRRNFLWLLLLGGFALLCVDLSDVYLWQDEAETALVARHLQTYGLPLSTDGRTWIQQAPEAFREFSRDYVWTFHPWLQYLVTATAFAVLGVSTFAARLPFVLAGLATVLALYGFIARWLPDKRSARVAAVLLLLCVPFVVLTRQCRYYALSALWTLLTVDGYLWLRSDRPWAVPYFVLSAALLFHSFYAAFFPTLAALVAHMFVANILRALQSRRRTSLLLRPALPTGSAGRFVLALLLIALLTLPWTDLIPAWRGSPSALLSAAPVPSLGSEQAAATRTRAQPWEYFLGYSGYYFLQVTLWIFPLLFIPALLVVGLQQSQAITASPSIDPRSGRENRPAGARQPGSAQAVGHPRRQDQKPSVPSTWGSAIPAGKVQAGEYQLSRAAFCRTVGWVIVANIVALSTLNYTFFRYLTHLMPLLVALLAVAVTWSIEHSPVLGHALLVLLVTSNGLHILPYKLLSAAIPQQSPFWSWIVTSPATNWMGSIRDIRLRSDLWMYGQELVHSYEGPNEGLVAYLSAHATPGQTALVNYEDLPLQFYTDLNVLGGFSARGLTPDVRPDWVIDRKHGPYRDLLADILAAGSYERITIPFPDIRWENREEARQHHYLTVRNEDNVVLYRRLGD